MDLLQLSWWNYIITGAIILCSIGVTIFIAIVLGLLISGGESMVAGVWVLVIIILFVLLWPLSIVVLAMMLIAAIAIDDY